jgi:hypothetical protein
MSLHCKKCLTGRSGDEIGNPCRTLGCDGVIERAPAFRDLVDELPEPMTCPRRMHEAGPWEYSTNLDRWQQFKSNGNRVCSFCGSLHPEDLFALVTLAADAPDDAALGTVVEIEPSDKSFYTMHLPQDANGKVDVPQQRHEEYARAVRATRRRFAKYSEEKYPRA